MKKVILFLVVFLSFSVADSALLLKKGWQLIGSTTKIDNMDIFASEHVEQVWRYDAITQKWQGYSPYNSIQKKISDQGYSKISSIENWHGFWIKSKNDWVLTFSTDVDKRDENITLQKGWNLISLPINTVVSPHIFDGKTVWKYAKKDGWEFFEKEIKEDFPKISHITNSDGIWVKSDKEQMISVSTNSSKLHNFDNEVDMKAYIKDMLLTNQRPICGYYPMVRGGGIAGGIVMEDSNALEDGVAKGAVETPQANNTSGTNIQEKGVDESDIVKHNDTNIFYVSRDLNKYDQMYVNVTTFQNIVNNNSKPIDRLSINGQIDSLYLVNDRLVVLSKAVNNGVYKSKTSLPPYFSTYYMMVDIYNVSDIKQIEKVASFKIDGNMNNSRVIDGKLFLVTTFNPYIEKTYPKIYIDAPECKKFFEPQSYPESVEDDYEGSSGSSETIVPPKRASRVKYDDYKKYAKCYNLFVDKDGRYYRYDYDNPNITHEYLIPYVQKDSNAKNPLITPKTFFAPSKKDQTPTITTVSKIDIQSTSLEKTSSILGYTNTVYASKKALYLVSNKYPIFYNFDRYQERSVIYKFSLDDSLKYKASGFVNGYVLNQFSLSEYDDILRIASTEGNSWQNNTINSLYTLSQHEDLLLINGVLSGLGKDGETIRSVRFIGNHGYVVTFRQTDPFYTIDLSDANNPKKAGELEIDGYSSYLHPIDETHILGIGRDAKPDGQVMGLKMELFYVGDFNNPQSVSTYSFGNRYSYSELENNHKALAYRDSDKLLGFAYSMDKGLNELGVFKITGESINAYKSIKSPNTNQYYNSFERGLIFDFGGQTYVAYFANGQIAYRELNSLN
jgi:uncharacterized secreted protein with C-terminal beta-propeller domain